MNYEEILDIAQNDDEIQHLRTLISARGAKMNEKVDADFLSMLAEEGYDSDAVRLISNQLEELRRFGLVKETAAGWRFDEATRLKNLLGRKEAIIDREKDTRTVNHGLIERLAIERDISTAAPWLIEVAGCFRPGDANEIAYAMDVLASDSRYTGDSRVLRRLIQAAKIMERK